MPASSELALDTVPHVTSPAGAYAGGRSASDIGNDEEYELAIEEMIERLRAVSRECDELLGGCSAITAGSTLYLGDVRPSNDSWGE